MEKKDKRTYIGIGYWYNDDHEYFPDPAWFVEENYEEEEKKKVIEYIKNSKALMHSRGVSWCRFNCGIDVPGSSDMTDGEYVYPSGLVHYVEYHNVKLPKEFLDKILKGKKTEHEIIIGSRKEYIVDYFDHYIDFNWWINQKGIDSTKSSKKEDDDENTKNIYIYKDGTKKIETEEKIEMIFPDGRIEVIMKEM